MGEGSDVGPEWCSRVVGVGVWRNGKGAGWMAIGWWVAVGGIYRGWEEGLSEWRGGSRGGWGAEISGHGLVRINWGRGKGRGAMVGGGREACALAWARGFA